jgi:hypothetical protein
MTRDSWTTVETPTTSVELIDQQQQSRQLLTTSRRISEFSSKKEPRPGDVIVYIDGTFDLFRKF